MALSVSPCSRWIFPSIMYVRSCLLSCKASFSWSFAYTQNHTQNRESKINVVAELTVKQWPKSCQLWEPTLVLLYGGKRDQRLQPSSKDLIIKAQPMRWLLKWALQQESWDFRESTSKLSTSSQSKTYWSAKRDTEAHLFLYSIRDRLLSLFP